MHVRIVWKCQVDAGTKVESVEAAPSQPDLAGEAPPKGKVKKKRTKETFPTPDRKPSSEYYYSSASEADDDDSQKGDEDEQSDEDEPADQDDEPTEPLALHLDLHEELYGLPTPTKFKSHGSTEMTPTEVEKTPELPTEMISSDDEGSPSGVRDGKHADGATGTHKD